MISLIYLLVIILAFLLEIIDASFGGGYGTLLTPILLITGFDPFQVVPAVLVSQLSGDFLAAFFHHKFKNIDLSIGGKTFKVAVTLSVLSSIGCVISVMIAFNLPKLYLNLYIGTVVTAIGLILLTSKNKNFSFSWRRLIFLGSLAAFNKGISGGGYGPLVAGGQILTGVEAKSAIGITSLAEGITCIIAVLSYVLVGRSIDWSLSIMLSIGVVFSTPISAYIVRKIESRILKLILGIVTIVLGLLTILKITL